MNKKVKNSADKAKEKILAKSVLEAIKNKQVTARILAKRFGVHPSQIRDAINRLRSASVPIIANYRGYYLSYHTEDIEHQINSLQCRINAMLKAKQGLEVAMKVINNGGK